MSKSPLPKYRRQRRKDRPDLAFVELNGRRHYLGQYDTEDSKDELVDAGDSAAYAELHAAQHSVLRSVIRTHGFYDLFLIRPGDGRVVYSVFKEVDFGTSLRIGPHRESSMARTRASPAFGSFLFISRPAKLNLRFAFARLSIRWKQTPPRWLLPKRTTDNDTDSASSIPGD